MPQLQINTESIAVQAYTILKNQIIDGDYLPGDKISEQSVADRLQISRSPVREAIRRLANEGLIDYFPNRGAFVRVYSSKDISDCFEMRLLLERYAIFHISPELREAHIDGLRALQLEIMNIDKARYADLDAKLHESVVALCGNDILLTHYRLLYSQILTFREISLVDEEMNALATRSHVALLKAVINGKDERAVEIITKHLTESEAQVQKYFLRHRS